jgi:NAD(P)-dependent dehydrogenase (short-subunit alcohol dehydrogenase family)
MSDYVQRLFDISGKVCVVTGGGGVLPGAMSRALGSAGGRVAVLGRRAANTGEVAEAIRSEGGVAMAVVCDVLDPEACTRAREEVLARYGRVDVLVNGAGGASPDASTGKEQLEPEDFAAGVRTLFDVPLEAFRGIQDLNSIGTLIPVQSFLKPMVEQRAGCIVNISSMGADRPLTKSPAYSSGKAATDNLTKWLAVYLAKIGVRVNAISPGFFLTRQNKFLLTDEKTGDLTPRGGRILANTPMGRFGAPEDLITTLFWLISDASSFVTGTIVAVDGGFSAFGGV